MRKNDTRPILRGAKIITFLLGLLLLPTFIVIATPRQTYAEGLLNRVGCLMGSLLDANCSKPTTAPASTTTSPSSDTDPDSSASTPQGSIATDASATAPLPDITGLAPLSTLSQYPHNFNVAYTLPQIRDGTPAVLGAQTSVPLESTEQGWKVMGLLWYWWLLLAAAVTAGGLVLKRVLTPVFFKV